MIKLKHKVYVKFRCFTSKNFELEKKVFTTASKKFGFLAQMASMKNHDDEPLF